MRENTVPDAKGDTVLRIVAIGMSVIAVLLLLPASAAFLLSFMSLISGYGFTDAAPWWVFFLMVAVVFGLPGFILWLGARAMGKRIEQQGRSADSRSLPGHTYQGAPPDAEP